MREFLAHLALYLSLNPARPVLSKYEIGAISDLLPIIVLPIISDCRGISNGKRSGDPRVSKNARGLLACRGVLYPIALLIYHALFIGTDIRFM